MDNYLRALYILSFTGLLASSACESINRPQLACAELDWFELGRSDGVRGLDSQSWQKPEARCLGFSDSDHDSYLNGWNVGINEYCSESHGFAVGRSGQSYSNVCPQGQEAAFLRGLEAGKKIYNIETDNRQISAQLDELTQAVNRSPQSSPQELLRRIEDLEAQRLRNRAMINELQEQAESQLQ